MFNGPIELQAQFLEGDLALPIELTIEQNKGMKQVEGQPRNEQTGQARSRIMMGAVPQVPWAFLTVIWRWRHCGQQRLRLLKCSLASRLRASRPLI